MLNNMNNFFATIKAKLIKNRLVNSDLIPIGTKDSRYDGGYAPTAITVEDFAAGIITSFKQIQRGISVTNTTAVTFSASFKIPANTINSDTLLEVLTTAIRVSGNAARMQFVLLHNTTNSVTGATFLAQFTDLLVGNQFTHNTRSLFLDYTSNQLKTFDAANLFASDFGRTNTPVTVNVNFGIDNYIILALKNDSLSDITKVDYAQITSNKSIL
jgi:hypothetical protein